MSEPAKWLRGRSDEEAIIRGVLWQLLAGVSVMENCKLGITQIPSQPGPKYPTEGHPWRRGVALAGAVHLP